MTPPFKSFPLVLRLVMAFGMWMFNASIVILLVSSLLVKYCGYTSPVEGNTINLSALDVNCFLTLQAFSTIGGFMLTAMMFSVLESGEFIRYLGISRSLPWKMILLAVFAILAVQFFISYLGDLNSKIPFPSALSFLKEMEKSDQDLTNAFLGFKSFGQFLIISFVIAVIPAIAEEMFFRGLILGDMLKAKVNPLVAIVISGLLFALIHFEFHNTLALWLFGCFLGYLYYVSGSIWLSVTAHFVNNFLDVLLHYLYNLGVLKSDISNASVPLYLALISLAVFSFCVYVFNKWKVKPAFVEAEFDNEEMTE